MNEAAPVTRARKSSASLLMIGWREWAALPDLGVDRIHAKIDTGAKTSAIHAFQVREIDLQGEAGVAFSLHPVRGRKKPEVSCVAPLAGRRRIRSSNGQEEDRFLIETKIVLGPRRFKIFLTLTNRNAMGFRLLVGRDALRRRFSVDPGASHLMGEP